MHLKRRSTSMAALAVFCGTLLAFGTIMPVVMTSVWSTTLGVKANVTTASQFCPVTVDFFIEPDPLDVKSANGNAVTTVHFLGGLPEGYSSANVTSIRMRMKLADGGYGQYTIHALPHPANESAGVVKFLRSDVVYLVEGALGEVTLEVSGTVDGCDFAGTDTITVKPQGNDKKASVQSPDQQTALAPEVEQPEVVNEPANVQNEPETVGGDGAATEPVTTEPPLDDQQDVEVGTPAEEPKTVEPPKDETEDTKQEEPKKDEPVGQDTGPGRTAPPANVTETIPEDDAVTTPEKVVPPVEEPENVGQDEPGNDSPRDEPQKDERDVPVKEPIGEDPPADEVGDVPIKEPIDETEIPVIVPSPDRPQDQDNDEKPAAGPDESGQDTAPVVAGPPSRNPPPGSGNEQPQDVVGEQPPQGSAACPIDAEARIMPEVFDVAGLDAETSVLVRLPGGQALGDVPLVTMRVKLGPDQYGQFKVEGKPDPLLPVPGVFEFTQEQMLKVLEDRRGEVTLEVRGVLDGCEFVGTDKLTVIETVVEPPEPVTDETVNSEQPVNTEPVQDETQKTVNEPEQTTEAEPPADTTESEDQTQTSENAQTQPTESSEQDTPQAVEEEAPVESESVEGPEQAAKPELDEGEPQISEGME